MIDWEMIYIFLGIDTIVHVVIALIFVPLTLKLGEWFARRTIKKWKAEASAAPSPPPVEKPHVDVKDLIP